MLNLNTYDSDTLAKIASRLKNCTDSIGGTHRLLSLAEAVREAEKPVLQNKTASFHYPFGKVGWSKVLFADKVETLAGIVKTHDSAENLLETATKKERNAVRTLFPVTFTIEPDEGEAFTFKPFDTPDERTARINPLFELLFFGSPGLIKKVLKTATEG